MTKIEVIRMIGDVLTEIDVTVGSLPPGDPNIVELQDRRRLLDARQLMLSRQVFHENTARFQEAAARLAAVNLEIKGTIRRIDDMIGVIQNVTRFVDAVTSFMVTLAAFGERPSQSRANDWERAARDGARPVGGAQESADGEDRGEAPRVRAASE